MNHSLHCKVPAVGVHINTVRGFNNSIETLIILRYSKKKFMGCIACILFRTEITKVGFEKHFYGLKRYNLPLNKIVIFKITTVFEH